MPSFFETILAQGKKLFSGKSSGGTLGIDIGSSSVKVVQVKDEKGSIVLETYGELALGPYANEPVGKITHLDPEQVGTAIKDLLKQSNATATRAFFSLQSQSSLIFVLSLPEMSESELAQVIPNEARKFIPVPLSEVSLDWFVIPRKQTYAEEAQSGERKKIEILVVAVRNETLEFYQSIMKASELEVAGFEIEMFSIIRAVFNREITPVMVVDVGASSARIAIVEYGVIRMFHVVNRGAAFLTDTLSRSSGIPFEKAEDLKREIGIGNTGEHREQSVQLQTSISIIVSEMRSVLSQYERAENKSVSKVILVGGGSMIPGFREMVAQEFQVDTVMGDPFGKTQAPEFLRPVLLDAGPEFATSVGLALKELV